MICGANLNFDTLLTSIEGLEADLLSGIDLDALALKAQLETSLTGLVTDLTALIPELPTIPSISLQVEMQSLLGMIPSSPEYLAKLTSLTADFESGLATAGKDLTSLISDATDALTGGLDLCGAIPNFEIDSFGELTEKPLNALQAQIPVLEEKLSEITDIVTEKLNTEVAPALDEHLEKMKEIAKDPATMIGLEEIFPTPIQKEMETGINTAMAVLTSPGATLESFREGGDDA